MSQPPNFSAELLRLCGQMRDQTISEKDAARLNELLATHPQARRFYLQFMAVTAGLENGLLASSPEEAAPGRRR